MDLDPGVSKDVLARALARYLPGSLLVVDRGWGELIAHGVGVDFLKALGVVGVVGIDDVDSRSLVESLAALTERRTGYGHVVVLSTRLLLDVEADIARVVRAAKDVAGGSAYQKVVVATNISEAAHMDADPVAYAGGFRAVHGRLVGLTGDATGVSIEEVLHVDVPCMVFGKNAFAFPSRSGASFLGDSTTTTSSGRDAADMERELQARIVVNAHLLVSVSKMMDVQPEVFCVGPLSERVGNVLAYVPAHDSTRNVRAAFCIVDRALDTATPSEHSGYFLQQMLLCDAAGGPIDNVDDAVDELRPSMFHPGDASTSSGYVEFLTSKTQREALLFVRKWLKEAIRQSSLKFTGRSSKPGAVSAEDLEALCQVLRDDPAARARHSSLLQISEIACRCLRGHAAWDEGKSKAEHVARLSAEDGPDSLTSLILDELDAAKRGGVISVFDVVRHLMMGSFWLKRVGGAGVEEPRRAAIAEALAAACAARRGEERMSWIPEGAEADEQLVEVSRNVVEVVCSLPAGRSLREMTEDVLSKRDVPGMRHIGTSIAGLVKSGLGRIGIGSGSPVDYEIIVVFVLGGVSAGELADVRATVDSSGVHAGRTVLVGGSTMIVDPNDTLASVFSEL